MEKLTKEHLISRGFVCEREADMKTDTNGIWTSEVLTLYEDFWEVDSFLQQVWKMVSSKVGTQLIPLKCWMT